MIHLRTRSETLWMKAVQWAWPMVWAPEMATKSLMVMFACVQSKNHQQVPRKMLAVIDLNPSSPRFM